MNRTLATCCLAVAMAAALPAAMQNGGQQATPEGNKALGNTPGFDNRPFPQMDPNAAEHRAIEKRRKLEEDTEKLAQLTRELKAAVDKTDKGQMSLDIIRKADEISKLSKQIRDEMKQN